MIKKPEPYRDKLGPIPPENFDGDFEPGETPPKGRDPVHDRLAEHVKRHKPKEKT
jgi:hypothetical protein